MITGVPHGRELDRTMVCYRIVYRMYIMVYIYIYRYMLMCVYVYVMYIYIYVCMWCIHVHIYIYIYTHTHIMASTRFAARTKAFDRSASDDQIITGRNRCDSIRVGSGPLVKSSVRFGSVRLWQSIVLVRRGSACVLKGVVLKMCVQTGVNVMFEHGLKVRCSIGSSQRGV